MVRRMRFGTVAALLFASSFVLVRPALAAGPRRDARPMPRAELKAPPTPPRTIWYGWQTLLGVSAASTVAVLGVATRSTAVSWIGLSGMGLVGPVVHNAHSQIGRGFISLGLNLASGTVGALVSSSMSSCEMRKNQLEPIDPNCWPSLGTVRGLFVGVGVAALIDAFVLSHGPERPSKWSRLRPSGPELELQPSFAVVPGGTSFGLQGRF